MNKGRWIVRAASLTILLGFFMPSVLVSCSSGFMETSQSFSLADLADQADQAGLYLLPVALLVVGVLTFIKEGNFAQLKLYLWGQLFAMAVGLLSVVISSVSITNQIQQGSYDLFKVTPDFGAFILAAGFIAFGVGWAMQWQDLEKTVKYGQNIPDYYPAPPDPYPIPAPPPAFPPSSHVPPDQPYLELVGGNLSARMIPLHTQDFSIGRSSESDLRLPDSAVSRNHARLRYAQGSWFLQDQDSSGGTMVNGVPTDATRVKEGDEIEIGPFRFIFHS